MASNLRGDTILPSPGTSLGIGTASGTINFHGESQINTTGVITASNFKTGLTNVHSGGLSLGAGSTIGAVTGVTTYFGDGSQLSGISVDTTKIETGNTKVETVDTGSDGHVKTTTEGSERLRINSTGQVLVNTTTATNADNRIESHSAGGYNIVAKSTNGNGGYQNFTGLASNGTVTSYITHNGRGYFEDGVQFDSSGEVLDAYEEGTFTPTILNGWGILNSNPQIATGKYVRIGAIVYIYFSFKEGSGTGASFNGNRLALYNFPYNPDGTFGSGSGSTNLSHPLVAYTNSNSSNAENVIGVPGNNGPTVFSFITKASNGYGSFTGSNLGTSGQIFCAGTYRITGT